MDTNCNVNCPALKSQNLAAGNKCLKSVGVKEDVDGCTHCNSPHYQSRDEHLHFVRQGYRSFPAVWVCNELFFVVSVWKRGYLADDVFASRSLALLTDIMLGISQAIDGWRVPLDCRL